MTSSVISPFQESQSECVGAGRFAGSGSGSTASAIIVVIKLFFDSHNNMTFKCHSSVSFSEF